MKMAYFALAFVFRCSLDICSTWPIDWTVIGISLLAGFALASWFVDAVINDDPSSFKVHAHIVVDRCACIWNAFRRPLRLVLAAFGLALLEDKRTMFDSLVGLAENSLDLSDCFDDTTASLSKARKDNASVSRKISRRDAELLVLENRISKLKQDQTFSTLQHEAAMCEMNDRLRLAQEQLLRAQSVVSDNDSATLELRLKLDNAGNELWTMDSKMHDLQADLHTAQQAIAAATTARYDAERKSNLLGIQLSKSKVPASVKEERLSKACACYEAEIQRVKALASQYENELDAKSADLDEQIDEKCALQREIARLRGLLGLNSLPVVSNTVTATPSAPVPSSDASLAIVQTVGSTPTTPMQGLTAPNSQPAGQKPSTTQPSTILKLTVPAFVPAPKSSVSSDPPKASTTAPTVPVPELFTSKVTEPETSALEATFATPRASNPAAKVVESTSGASAPSSATAKWQQVANEAQRTGKLPFSAAQAPSGVELSEPMPEPSLPNPSSAEKAALLLSISESTQTNVIREPFGLKFSLPLRTGPRVAISDADAADDVSMTTIGNSVPAPYPLAGGMKTSQHAPGDKPQRRHHRAGRQVRERLQ
ncbi:hypothetical protein LTR95_012588, partial [Oleoguttula sp. CCFEE 5521]